MSLQLSFAHTSAQGPRPENQDATRLVTPAAPLAASKGYLFALADGVSHCADGALAAASTLQALALDYYATPETWTVAQALDRLLTAQNSWLRANGAGQPLLTTLSALVLRGRHFTLAHIGDCRVYRWHAGKLARLTQDHVWEQPGMQHVLKRAMGLDQHLVVDYLEGELLEAQSFLLLSDGVWATLDDQAIASILREQADPQLATQTLVKAAHLAGSQDNASALLVRIDTIGPANLADTLLHAHQWPLPGALKPGQPFEQWQVQALVAESRQSVVYRVLDERQQAWLLKTLPRSSNDDLAAQQNLLLEEWFLRRVAGRYFPQVHALSQRQHLYYLMREYPGRTLAEVFRQGGPLPLDQWQAIAQNLLRAVGMLHRRNILHRDIKPENLLLGDDGELRVLDFGLAYCPGLTPALTEQVAGTPSFIAPEAFDGAPPAAAQDLYATGVTLYFLLTGHYPYGEIEAFQRPRFGQPQTPSRYRPDVPDWLCLNLLRSVDADPLQRYETAEEWLLKLDQDGRTPPTPRPRPLLEREPLKVWRSVALASVLTNLIMIFWLLH